MNAFFKAAQHFTNGKMKVSPTVRVRRQNKLTCSNLYVRYFLVPVFIVISLFIPSKNIKWTFVELKSEWTPRTVAIFQLQSIWLRQSQVNTVAPEIKVKHCIFCKHYKRQTDKLRLHQQRDGNRSKEHVTCVNLCLRGGMCFFSNTDAQSEI